MAAALTWRISDKTLHSVAGTWLACPGGVRCWIVPLSVLVTACSGGAKNDAAPASADAGSATTASSNGAGATSGNASNSTGDGTTDGGGGSGGGAAFVASESVARRLSRAELDNTLETLLGDESAPAHQFLSEDEFSPYDNDYTLQLSSRALIDSLELLAADVAARAVASETFRTEVLPCSPADDQDAVCFRSIAEQLLTRAFRRVVVDEEVDPYMELLDFASEQVPGRTIDFYTSVDLLIRSVVQDPEFLYRIEVGAPTQVAGVVRLNDYEIATRMSYLLWGDMPDTRLFAEAASGGLADGAARRSTAESMLNDTKSRVQLKRFHAMWLGYRAIPHPEELTRAFALETNALLDQVLFDDPQSYLNLFTKGETYLNDLLAEHYGLPAPQGGEGWVPYGDSGRAGILSHGSVLSAFSKFSDTSPTQRGILVRTRLMCDAVPPPPPDINTDEPPSSTEGACKIERYDEHRSSAACANCHGALDPIGFGLENFDMAGRFRDHDNDNEACLIDGQGTVEPYGAFSGPAELAQILVDQGEIDDCVIRQFLSFALGRAVHGSESELVENLVATFRQTDHALSETLLDYIADDAFALRLEPEIQ